MSSQPRRIKNPLEEHAYINEAIKRENKYARTNETFTLNPHSLQMLSDKPNNNNLLGQEDINLELGDEVLHKLA